ncbi:MAG: hypothetical protein ACLU3U_09040 [Gallintestinimicrobium sp.]
MKCRLWIGYLCRPGGAALFAARHWKARSAHPEFQGRGRGDDCYGELIRKGFARKNIRRQSVAWDELGRRKPVPFDQFTNEKDRSFLTYRGTERWRISIDKGWISRRVNAAHIHMTGYEGSKNFTRRIFLC